VVHVAFERGPYPYDQRLAVVAAVDQATEEALGTLPDEYHRALRQAYKRGAEVRSLTLSLPADEVAAPFRGGLGRGRPGPGEYALRLALCRLDPNDADEPPAVVAVLDEESAQSAGTVLDGPLERLPLPYRRAVAHADGEVREILVGLSRDDVEALFWPVALPGTVLGALGPRDPRDR
jgi:hypothetical protein